MGIIEKLGITPIEAIPVCDNPLIMNYCEEPAVRKLESQRNEMLEALIGIKKHITGMIQGCEEDMRDGVDEAGIIAEALQQLYESMNFESIQKATGKSWKEIKELRNGN